MSYLTSPGPRDKIDPSSPWYEEPPEGVFRDIHSAADYILERLGDELVFEMIGEDGEGNFVAPVHQDEWVEALGIAQERVAEG